MKPERVQEYTKNLIEGVSKKSDHMKVTFNRFDEGSIMDMKSIFDFHISHDNLESEKDKLWSKTLKDSYFNCPISTVATYLSQINNQQMSKSAKKSFS